jgi:hypothetical protein
MAGNNFTLHCVFPGCEDLVTGTLIDDETGLRVRVCTFHTDLALVEECELRYVSSFG